MSLVDNLDPVTLFGIVAPDEVPRSAMRAIERGRSHFNGIYRYAFVGHNIIRENILNESITYYESNGKRCYCN